MKHIRFFSFIIILAFVLPLCARPVYAENSTKNSMSAKAYILTEARTGKILIRHNENARLPMASLTKEMVLLIAAEEITSGHIAMTDQITVSAHAASMDGSVVWLEAGEIMTLADLIKSVVIASANDACVAVAEHIAGSESAFVARMNKRAAELGMENTHFANAVGYDDERHYSTAADIAKLTAELFRYDIYDEYFQTRLDSVRTGTNRETQLLNTNKLIGGYDGLHGGKTGTTDNAGYCLTECAERGDMRLVCVILGANSEEARVTAGENLLDKGFDTYQMCAPSIDPAKLEPLPVKHGVSANIRVRPVSEAAFVIPKGSAGRVEYHYSMPESVDAPIRRGQKIGKVQATLDGELVYQSDIVSYDMVEELTFLKSLQLMFEALLTM